MPGKEVPSLPRLGDVKGLLQWAKLLVEALQKYLLQESPMFPQWTWIAQPSGPAVMSPGQIARNNAAMASTNTIWLHSIEDALTDHTLGIGAVEFGGGSNQQDLLLFVQPTGTVRYKITGLTNTAGVDGNVYTFTVGMIGMTGPDQAIGSHVGITISYVATS